jgi:hypothetical protein
MSDQAWLAYTLAFITPDERQILQVPSLADRAGYDNGRGYTLTDLEVSIGAMDVTTLKKFRQASCSDPVAIQILALYKSNDTSGSSSSTARPPRFAPRIPPGTKESHATALPPCAGKGQGRPAAGLSTDSSKLDQPSSLPQKDGRVDMDQYSKYKEEGLHQRIHQAIRAKHCIRCWSPDHLRSSCSEPPKKWEEDFNKGKASFWGPKPKQARPQWLAYPESDGSFSKHSLNVLYSVDSGLCVALDTGSEISIGQIDFLQNVRLVRKPVFVEGIGGTCVFYKVGDLLLAGNCLFTVFAVEKGDLPPDFHVLFVGDPSPHLLELDVSLDFALHHPGCPLSEVRKQKVLN